MPADWAAALGNEFLTSRALLLGRSPDMPLTLPLGGGACLELSRKELALGSWAG